MTKLNILIFISLLVLSSSVYKNQIEDGVPVGTIIYSILPPDIFLSKNKGWTILNGQDVDPIWKLTSDYKKSKLPMASGRFIRSMNYFGVGDDIIRTVGSYQEYGTAKPITKFNTNFDGLKHSNVISASMETSESTINYLKLKKRKRDDIIIPARKSVPRMESNTSYMDYEVLIPQDGFTNPDFYITGGGDIETRPGNVAFYVYIKVD